MISFNHVVKEKTSGGLIIPEKAKEKPNMGKVIDVGPGTKDIEMLVEEGDSVLYGQHAGTEVSFDNKHYVLMRQSDIIAIV